jgi:butyryl-CoA dehydrogenase
MFKRFETFKLLSANWCKFTVRSVSNVTSLNFSETHIMLKNTCKEFADKEIIPQASKIDKTSVYPEEIIKKLGELGLMSIEVPEKVT